MHKGMGRSQVSRKAIHCVDAQPNLQLPFRPLSCQDIMKIYEILSTDIKDPAGRNVGHMRYHHSIYRVVRVN